jgi:uncharacterized repeat protein (TIGR01451 family)
LGRLRPFGLLFDSDWWPGGPATTRGISFDQGEIMKWVADIRRSCNRRQIEATLVLTLAVGLLLSVGSASGGILHALGQNGPAAAAAVACGANGTIANDTGFEDADANLAVSAPGCTDWNSFAPVTWNGAAPYQTASGSSGPFAFAGATDDSNSHTDTKYTGGVKQANECPLTDQGNVNFKSDLARVYVAATLGANGHEYIYLAWVRAPLNNVSADVHVGFEINQSSTPCANNDGFVRRTNGDILLVYNFQGGVASIAMSTWSAAGWSAETPLNAAVAEAAVFNAPGSVADDLKPAGAPNPATQEFGEAGIDLTAAGVSLGRVKGRACERFANVFGESRTSGDSTTAQMEDFVGPAGLDLNNCASPTIVTTQQPGSGSTGGLFKDKATMAGLVTPDGTGSITFKLYAQQNCQGAPLDTETVGNINANGDYPTPNGVALPSAGTYYWVASFSGDNFNNPASSGCNDEPVVVNAPHVTLTKTADHTAPVNAGDPIGFTVEVKNSGPGDATGVVLNDPLPAGSGSGVTWAIDPAVGTPARFVLAGAKGAQKLSLASSTVPAGADYKVRITAATSQTECSGTYDNTATLTLANGSAPNPASARESCAFRVDLSVTKAGSPATQELGQGNITWTMVVTNNGPDTDTGVTIADPMPGGNTFVSATTTQGSCTGGAILTCNLGTMAAGDKVTITLVTTPSTTGPQTNTVTVVGDRPETDTTNNRATATVQVTKPFAPPPVVYCVAVSKIIPKQLIVGRKTTLTIYLTKHRKPAKGVRVHIKGPKLNLTTKRSNAKGVIKQTIKMKKAGIDIFIPLARKHCNTKRIGVTGVFTPPVTG